MGGHVTLSPTRRGKKGIWDYSHATYVEKEDLDSICNGDKPWGIVNGGEFVIHSIINVRREFFYCLLDFNSLLPLFGDLNKGFSPMYIDIHYIYRMLINMPRIGYKCGFYLGFD